MIDCRAHMLGRLASIIAKELLSGQHIVRAAAGDAQSCPRVGGLRRRLLAGAAACVAGQPRPRPRTQRRVRPGGASRRGSRPRRGTQACSRCRNPQALPPAAALALTRRRALSLGGGAHGGDRHLRRHCAPADEVRPLPGQAHGDQPQPWAVPLPRAEQDPVAHHPRVRTPAPRRATPTQQQRLRCGVCRPLTLKPATDLPSVAQHDPAQDEARAGCA